MNLPNSSPMPSILANRYRVLNVLGDGGFGTTYLAEDTQMPSSRKCVVKQLKPVQDNPQIYQLVKERFQREAAILETLGDGFDQIPHLYAYFSEVDQFFLVEEWVEGETLTQKITREGPVSELEVRRILSQTLPVLAYIHEKQMVHRDIKPDNIILRQKDGKPVLIDFGAVKETMGTVLDSQGNSSRSIVVGTPGFMPSEQLAGRPLYSSDLYSLGLTAIYLLTGKIPQSFETHPATGLMQWQPFVPGISAGFASFLDRAIQLQPRDRFTHAHEMLAALQSFDAQTVRQSPPAPPQMQPTIPHHYPSSQPAAGQLNSPAVPPVVSPAVPPPVSPHYAPPIQPIYQAPVPENQASTPGYQASTPGYQASVPGYQASTPGYQTPSGHPSSPPPSSPPTIPIPGLGQPTPQPYFSSTPAEAHPGNGEWKKATIIGGLIGLSILGGAMLLRAQLGDVFSASDPVAVSPSPTPSPSIDPGSEDPPDEPSDNSAPVQTNTPSTDQTPSPIPTPSPTSDPSSDFSEGTNARIVGRSGSKNIRSGPGTNYGVKHIAYPGDRVQVLTQANDSGGYLWYQVSFPKSGAEGWIAGQLLQVDGQPIYQPPKPKPRPTLRPTLRPQAPANQSDATIVGTPGSKNIRSGPGTNYGVEHIAYPGDRVQIIASDYDSGGYLWYKVYFPKSGAQGWLAAQLIQRD